MKHYSLRTEGAYAQWVKRYIYFHVKRHPAELGKVEVEAFLTSLAVQREPWTEEWSIPWIDA